MNLDRLLYYENIRTDKIVRSAVELAEKARAEKNPGERGCLCLL